MTGHTLSDMPYGMVDWLAMAITSGLAAGVKLLVLLGIGALAKYVIDHSSRRVS